VGSTVGPSPRRHRREHRPHDRDDALGRRGLPPARTQSVSWRSRNSRAVAPDLLHGRRTRQHLALPADNPHTERLTKVATDLGIVLVCGSFLEHDPKWPDAVFNTTLAVGEGRTLLRYRKRCTRGSRGKSTRLRTISRATTIPSSPSPTRRWAKSGRSHSLSDLAASSNRRANSRSAPPKSSCACPPTWILGVRRRRWTGGRS
jgi:hypothetical protein